MRLFGLIGRDVGQRRAVLMELVAELSKRDLKVAALFEAAADFDPDKPGKDSYEHRKAGASEVLLMAPQFSALMHENGARPAPSARQLAQGLTGADLVLIDGFEAEAHPKARVGAAGEATRCDASVIALLDPDGLDIAALADLALAQAQWVAA
ncbi:MAG: molybdopterin-guanine dinucleotide biosynthesis protein MobB [Rhodospirillales bacterium]|jgi:molybdopterin-guanine dinucleotide biosynthesis protein B|nr:molybdopterin-guanine dinucleotide biosynthesis protein MobB [Rhodospirillales bacterium]